MNAIPRKAPRLHPYCHRPKPNLHTLHWRTHSTAHNLSEPRINKKPKVVCIPGVHSWTLVDEVVHSAIDFLYIYACTKIANNIHCSPDWLGLPSFQVSVGLGTRLPLNTESLKYAIRCNGITPPWEFSGYVQVMSRSFKVIIVSGGTYCLHYVGRGFDNSCHQGYRV